MTMLRIIFLLLMMIRVVSVGLATAQLPDDGPGDDNGVADTVTAEEVSREELFARFKKTLTKATLVGQFTVVGRDAPPTKESYTINNVTKLDAGDIWLFNSRIRYNDRDLTVPLPLAVKWAGMTPVITVDNVTIPGLGTFDARVMIHGGKYTGTWRHGDVSGFMFGKIVHPDEPPEE
jgi:hypothetical protein